MTDEELENSPLGRAAKLIGDASDAIDAAWDAWIARENGWHYDSIELEPDSESLGFALIIDFNDGPPVPAREAVRILSDVMTKYGIARVHCVRTDAESAFLPEGS